MPHDISQKYACLVAVGAILAAMASPASANVVTDWDEIAVKTLQTPFKTMVPFPTLPGMRTGRTMAMTHLAMFNAVNCIAPKYQGYGMQPEPSPDTAEDAAAASAAGNMLIKLVPNDTTLPMQLQDYLAKLPNGPAKDRGIKLGAEVADKLIKLRDNDGTETAKTDFRPVTQPGVYTATLFQYGVEAAGVKPMALTSPQQFRPGPYPDLKSDTWTQDYNEIKELGERDSPKRTPQQTEDARFWLTTGPIVTHQILRQIVQGKNMSVIDSTRFMAVVSVAEFDAGVAVLEAKWHYLFWRPMTAIRNGDIDDNPATERDATWMPIDPTPPHPEYPCAHCITSGAMSGAIKKLLGTAEIPEVALTTTTAPGATHRFTNIDAINAEVSAARIYAGFHYRYSTVVGSAMGNQVGEYVATTVMLPLK
jgi:hypothetical protein